MNEDYVDYQTALALKKAGFDDPCNFYYTKEDAPDGAVWFTGDPRDPQDYNHLQDDCPFAKPICSAPHIYHAQKWLREEWDWHIIVEPQIWDGLTYEFKLWHRFHGYENTNRGFHFSSYECALSAGIKSCVEILLK